MSVIKHRNVVSILHTCTQVKQWARVCGWTAEVLVSYLCLKLAGACVGRVPWNGGHVSPRGVRC